MIEIIVGRTGLQLCCRGEVCPSCRVGEQLETPGDEHLAAYDQWLPTEVHAQEQIMKFRADVEPTEPMRGCKYPPKWLRRSVGANGRQ